MILPAGQIGKAGLTVSRGSLAALGALVAAALTPSSALGPAAIKDLRSLGRDASSTARSITEVPATNPRARPLPVSNIISRIARVSSFLFHKPIGRQAPPPLDGPRRAHPPAGSALRAPPEPLAPPSHARGSIAIPP